jgi:hypothetical protein
LSREVLSVGAERLWMENLKKMELAWYKILFVGLEK